MTSEKQPLRKPKPRNPVQDRGIKTKQKLIDTGEDLFSKRGYHNITADEIARAADLSVGTFYAYFANKRELLFAIIDVYLEKYNIIVSEGTKAILSTKDIDVSTIITNIIRLLLEEHKKSSLFIKESLKMAYSDEEVKKRLNTMDITIKKLIKNTLISMGVNHKRATSIAFLVYYAVEGVVHKITLDTEQVDEDEILNELTNLFSIYTKNL